MPCPPLTPRRLRAALAALALLAGLPVPADEPEHEPPGGWLGVALIETATADGEPGVQIIHVRSGSPAAAAGIREGDRVVTFDAVTVLELADLTAHLEASRPGATFRVTVARGPDTVELHGVLGRREPSYVFERAPLEEVPDAALRRSVDALRRAVALRGPSTAERVRAGAMLALTGAPGGAAQRVTLGPLLGVELRDLTPELRVHFGAEPDAGLLVSRVEDGSPAQVAGIRVGDLLVGIRTEPVDSWPEVLRELAEWPEGRPFPLRVMRQGAPVELALDVPSLSPERFSPRAHASWAAGDPDALFAERDRLLDRIRGLETRIAELEASLAALEGDAGDPETADP